MFALSAVLTITTGCASFSHPAGVQIPAVTLAETPTTVRTTILGVASGRRIQKINRVRELEGPVYRAYIADKLGLQLLSVDGAGKILDNAVVIPFDEMPDAVRKSARTGVAGQIQVCRKSILTKEPRYLIDYLIDNDEPVFAVIDGKGLVHAVIGYAEADAD